MTRIWRLGPGCTGPATAAPDRPRRAAAPHDDSRAAETITLTRLDIAPQSTDIICILVKHCAVHSLGTTIETKPITFGGL